MRYSRRYFLVVRVLSTRSDLGRRWEAGTERFDRTARLPGVDDLSKSSSLPDSVEALVSRRLRFSETAVEVFFRETFVRPERLALGDRFFAAFGSSAAEIELRLLSEPEATGLTWSIRRWIAANSAIVFGRVLGTHASTLDATSGSETP